MLIFLSETYTQYFSFLNLFNYITFRTGGALLTSLFFSLIFGNIIINSLSKKINLYSFAFGEKDEISKLHIQDFTPGSALHTVEKKNISKTKTGKKTFYCGRRWKAIS